MKSYLAIGLIRFLALLPLSWARALGSIIGQLSLACNTRTAQVAKTNLQLCFPEKSQSELNTLLRKTLIETGKTVAESGIVWCKPIDKVKPLITSIEGEDLLDAAIERKQGISFLLLHHGNWEVVNHYLSHKVNFMGMYKPSKLPQLDQWIEKARLRTKIKLVPANKNGVLAYMKALKRGDAVLMLPDQEPELKSGVFAPFFGVPALTGKFTSSLARSNPQAAILCTYVKRNPQGFTVVIKKADDDIKIADAEVSASALNRLLESCILDHPEQYQWGYKRFKRRPEGESKIY